jgi:GNAT superfamily N-acetyltransferase
MNNESYTCLGRQKENMIAARLLPDDPALPEVLALIRSEFATMDGVIDPPSSMHQLTLLDLTFTPSELWVIGNPVIACVILTPKPPALYIGKLAVAEAYRGQGLARVLINIAAGRARDLHLTHLELQTRIELVGNQAAFAAMGFVETARTAHKGYDRPTSITYQRKVTP